MSINNVGIFNAALAGVMAGMARNSANPLTDTYVTIANEAAALATEVDSLIAPIAGGPNTVQSDTVEELSQTMYAFFFRQSGSVTPADYLNVATAIHTAYVQATSVALVDANNNTFYWQGQSTWSFSGNPADDTSQTTAIGTHVEFRKRIGNGPLRQNTVLTLLADADASDVWDFEYDRGGYAASYVGTETIVQTGRTITAYVNRDPATRTPNQLTASGAAFSWNTYAAGSYYIRMTNGPAVGCAAAVALDLTGNQARVGTFLDPDLLTETQPVVGNTYNIVKKPSIQNVVFGSAAGMVLRGIYVKGFPVYGCNIEDGTVNAGIIPFTECPMDYFTPLANFFVTVNPIVILGSTWSTGVANVRAGVFFGGDEGTSFNSGCLIGFYNGTLFQSISIVCQAAGIFAFDMGMFDTHHTGISMQWGAGVVAVTLWGSTGTGTPFGVTLDKTSNLMTQGTTQTLTGSVGTKDVSLPVTGATTWAAARAGIKDSATSNATTMPV